MEYQVKYRKPGAFIWRKISNVKGDLSMVSEGLPVRVFILADETRIEMPALLFEFVFSKERHAVILENMEKQSGQKLALS